MCSNILKWSLCLFFLLLYFCPYIHAQIHGYHHSHGIDQASPSTGTATTLDINNNNNNNSGEKCPCIPRDQCPRVYGEAATDVKELGFLRPCRQFGTVRCCGVTVSIRIEHEKEDDFDKIEKVGSGKNGNNSSTIFSKVKLDQEELLEIDVGGIHSNYLWDREEDLDVAESNQSTSANNVLGPNGTSAGKHSRRTIKLKPRKKLSSMAELRKNIVVRSKPKGNMEEEESERSDVKEDKKQRSNSNNNNGERTPLPEPSPRSESSENEQPLRQISKISKMRIARPATGLKAIKPDLLDTNIDTNPNIPVLTLSAPSTLDSQPVISESESVPNPTSDNESTTFPKKLKKRILRRKKIQNNMFPSVSTSTNDNQQEQITDHQINPEPQEITSSQPIATTPFEVTTDKPKQFPNLVTSTTEASSPTYQHKSPLFATRRKVSPLLHSKQDNTNNQNNEPLVHSPPVPNEQQINPIKSVSSINTYKFSSKLHPNRDLQKSSKENLEDLKNDNNNNEPQLSQKESSVSSTVSISKPLRRRLRPIRPKVDENSSVVNPITKKRPLSSLNTIKSSGEEEEEQNEKVLSSLNKNTNPGSSVQTLPLNPVKTSASYTSTSSASSSSAATSSYDSPNRKLQKFRKRIRQMVGTTASTTTTVPSTTTMSPPPPPSTTAVSSTRLIEHPSLSSSTSFVPTATTELFVSPSTSSNNGNNLEISTSRYKLSSNSMSNSEIKLQNQNRLPFSPQEEEREQVSEHSTASTDSEDNSNSNNNVRAEENVSPISSPTLLAHFSPSNRKQKPAASTSNNYNNNNNESNEETKNTSPLIEETTSNFHLPNFGTHKLPPFYKGQQENRFKSQTEENNSEEFNADDKITKTEIDKNASPKRQHPRYQIINRAKQQLESSSKQSTHKDDNEEDEQQLNLPISTFSTYSKIRKGTPEDENHNAQIYRNKNHQPTKTEEEPIQPITSRRRFSIPQRNSLATNFDRTISTTLKPIMIETQDEENYDVVLDKNVRRLNTYQRPPQKEYNPEPLSVNTYERPQEQDNPEPLSVNTYQRLPQKEYNRPETLSVNTYPVQQRQKPAAPQHVDEEQATNLEFLKKREKQATNLEFIKKREQVPRPTESPKEIVPSKSDILQQSGRKRMRIRKPTQAPSVAYKTNENVQSTPTPYTGSQKETVETYLAVEEFKKPGAESEPELNSYGTTNKVQLNQEEYGQFGQQQQQQQQQQPIRISSTIFPPFRRTTPRTSSSTEAPQYFGSSGSASSSRRRVVKPSLLLESADNNEQTLHNSNYNESPEPVTASPYNNNNNFYQELRTTTNSPAFVYSYEATTKNTPGPPAYSPSSYEHEASSVMPISTEKPTFIFPPYRFAITSKPSSSSDEDDESESRSRPKQKPHFRRVKVSNPTTTTTESPPNYLYGNQQLNYFHTATEPSNPVYQIPATEAPKLYYQQHVSTTPMPIPSSQEPQLFYYQSTTMSPITKEYNGVSQQSSGNRYQLNGQFSELTNSGRMKSTNSSRFKAPEKFELLSNFKPIHTSSTPESEPFKYNYIQPSTTPLPLFTYNQMQPSTTPLPLFTYNQIQPSSTSAPNFYFSSPPSSSTLSPYEGRPLYPERYEAYDYNEKPDVQLKVAGLTGQHHYNQQQEQQYQQKPQVPTVIDIQNAKTNTDGITFPSSHQISFPRQKQQHGNVQSSSPNRFHGFPSNAPAETFGFTSTTPFPSIFPTNQQTLSTNPKFPNTIQQPHHASIHDDSVQQQMERQHHYLELLGQNNLALNSQQPHQQQNYEQLIKQSLESVLNNQQPLNLAPTPAPVQQQQPFFRNQFQQQQHYDSTTPNTVWKFPTLEPEADKLPAHPFFNQGIQNGFPFPQMRPNPATQQQNLGARPGSSVVAFGTGLTNSSPSDALRLGHSGHQPLASAGFNPAQQQFQQNKPPSHNPKHVKFPTFSDNPISSNGRPEKPPHYINEYHQHHAISQQILKQLKNPANSPRMSRATNLDDFELPKNSTNYKNKDRSEDMDLETGSSNIEISSKILRDGKEVLKEDQVQSLDDNTETPKFSAPELIPYFSVSESNEQDALKSVIVQETTNNGNPETFQAPTTIQRGFLPIVPYSEQDPGPLLVNVKDLNVVDPPNENNNNSNQHNSNNSRESKALLTDKVVVSLTDDEGTPRPLSSKNSFT